MQESIQQKLLQLEIVSFPLPEDKAQEFKEGRWTPQEHRLFLQAIDIYGSDWVKLASFIGSRSIAQARSHAQKYFNKKKNDSEKIGTKPIEEIYDEEKVQTRSKKPNKCESSSTVSIPQRIQQQKQRDDSLQKNNNNMECIIEKQIKSKARISSKKIQRECQNIQNQNIDCFNNKNSLPRKNEGKELNHYNKGDPFLQTPRHTKKRREASYSVTKKKPYSLSSNEWKHSTDMASGYIAYSATEIPMNDNRSAFNIPQKETIYRNQFFEPSLLISFDRFSSALQNELNCSKNNFFDSKGKVLQYYPSKHIIPIVIVNKYLLKHPNVGLYPFSMIQD